MKGVGRTLAVVAAASFALAALARGGAAERIDGSRKIELRESAVLLGVAVPPGSYTVRWTCESGSDEVRLQIRSGSTVLASGKGLWTKSDRPSSYEALVYRATQ